MLTQPYTDAEAQEGQMLRDDALDGHDVNHAEDLIEVRTYAKRLYQTRERCMNGGATVDADDVRRYCQRHQIEIGPWLGSVFRGKKWEHVGWMLSRDAKQHATGLRTWRYVGS